MLALAVLNLISIHGREIADVYQLQAPSEWKMIVGEKGTDTKKPLAEFLIGPEIRATVHNFPGMSIPPQAQMGRWQKQFAKLDPQDVKIEPVAWNGYAGFAFEATGTVQGKPTTMLAWTLQLDPCHVRILQKPDKTADVTIKVVGPPTVIFENRIALIRFARSFELKSEIPCDP